MLGRSVGILSASALGASAFLIPAGIAPPPQTESNHITSVFLNPQDQSIRLPCPDCVFYTKEEDLEKVKTQDDLLWVQGGANDLVLRFTVSDDGQRLLLNGETIYPIDGMALNAHPIPSIEVDQVPASAEWTEIVNHDTKITPAAVTAYGLEMIDGLTTTPQGDELIPIRWRIFELENVPVTVNAVHIDLLRAGDGELLIMGLENVPQVDHFPPSFIEDNFPPPEGIRHPEFDLLATPMHHPTPFGDPDCGRLPALLCRIHNMIESKINAVTGPRGKGGCRGRKHRLSEDVSEHLRGSNQELSEDDSAPPHPHGPHHHMGPHSGHRHHRSGRHHFLRFLRHGFLAGIAAALIPTLAGVFVGVMVSVVGLLVGRLIAAFWFHVVRGGRRGNASVRLEDNDSDDAPDYESSDKSPLLSEVVTEAQEVEAEALPGYEHAPAYEEREKSELA